MTEARTPAQARRRTAREVRRDTPALRHLWWGAGAALVGTEVLDVVALMLTTAAYGALLSAGALGVALRLAPLVLAPVLTAALDRRPEQRASFARASVLARAAGLGLFALVVAVDAPSWAAYVTVAVVAGLDAAYLSATRATLPRILRREDGTTPDLGQANSMLVVQWNAVQMVAPPLVVLALDHLAVPTVLALGAAALLAAWALLGEYVRAHLAAGSAAGAPAASSRFRDRLVNGFTAVRADPVARAVVVVAAATQGVVFAFSVTLPQVTAVPGALVTTGVALSAMAVGSVLGARAVAAVTTPAAHARTLLAATATVALAVALVAVDPGPATALPAALLVGAGAGAGAVPRATLVQSRFRDEQLGGAVVATMVLGQVLMPVLPALWEQVADLAGQRWAYVALAALPVLALLHAVPTLLAQLRPSPTARQEGEP